MKTIILTCLILSVIIASVMSAEGECLEGDSKQVACNTCKCTNGLWSCSKKFCIRRNRRDRVCEPGTTFKRSCNTCVCNKDGTNAACTLRACL